MINTVVYLRSDHDPSELLHVLLTQQLVATVSVDKDNVFYKRSGADVVKVVNTVITMQTRALLFNDICRIVAEHYGNEVPVHSVPIVAANSTFEQHIKQSTKEPDARIATVLK